MARSWFMARLLLPGLDGRWPSSSNEYNFRFG
jgi:hypothetical protein